MSKPEGRVRGQRLVRLTETLVALGVLVAVLAASTGCATVVNGRMQPVTIVSDPPAAEVLVGAESAGQTPTDVRLRRGDGNAALRLQKDGFVPRVVRPRRSLSHWLLGNVALGAVLGYLSTRDGNFKANFATNLAGTVGLTMAVDLFVTRAGFAFEDTLTTSLTPAAEPSAGAPRAQGG